MIDLYNHKHERVQTMIPRFIRGCFCLFIFKVSDPRVGHLVEYIGERQMERGARGVVREANFLSVNVEWDEHRLPVAHDVRDVQKLVRVCMVYNSIIFQNPFNSNVTKNRQNGAHQPSYQQMNPFTVNIASDIYAMFIRHLNFQAIR